MRAGALGGKGGSAGFGWAGRGARDYHFDGERPRRGLVPNEYRKENPKWPIRKLGAISSRGNFPGECEMARGFFCIGSATSLAVFALAISRRKHLRNLGNRPARSYLAADLRRAWGWSRCRFAAARGWLVNGQWEAFQSLWCLALAV